MKSELRKLLKDEEREKRQQRIAMTWAYDLPDRFESYHVVSVFVGGVYSVLYLSAPLDKVLVNDDAAWFKSNGWVELNTYIDSAGLHVSYKKTVTKVEDHRVCIGYSTCEDGSTCKLQEIGKKEVIHTFVQPIYEVVCAEATNPLGLGTDIPQLPEGENHE